MIELPGAEEALDCPGSAGEEVLGTPVEWEEEEEEDLRGANLAAAEEAEVGGAGTSDPSPGELTWWIAAASFDWKWTNQDGMSAVSVETWLCDVVIQTVDVLRFVIMRRVWRIKVVVTGCVFLRKHQIKRLLVVIFLNLLIGLMFIKTEKIQKLLHKKTQLLFLLIIYLIAHKIA